MFLNLRLHIKQIICQQLQDSIPSPPQSHMKIIVTVLEVIEAYTSAGEPLTAQRQDGLMQWVSTFLMLQPFSIILHVVLTLNYKIIFINIS